MTGSVRDCSDGAAGDDPAASPHAHKKRAIAVAAAVALLATAAACSASPTDVAGHGRPPSGATHTTTSLTATPGSSAPALATDGTFAVGTTTQNVVEPPSAEGEPLRSLPTQIWYPAVSQGRAAVPDRAHAPYPLLVFSQGFDLGVSAYSALLEAWASAGYVVAAPTYPHTDPSDSPGLDENDIVNHPADLRSVITTLLDSAHERSTVLSGLVDGAAIGVVGHSDGGDVSLAVSDNSCCHDPRVKAAVILSGAELAGFGGTYFATGAAYVPLLVVQGNIDTINVPACSAQIYNSARSPKYYLDLLGAQHAAPYVNSGGYQDVVARVVTDFFDARLRGEGSAVQVMSRQGNVAGTAQLIEGAAAPPEPGSCPGAPSP